MTLRGAEGGVREGIYICIVYIIHWFRAWFILWFVWLKLLTWNISRKKERKHEYLPTYISQRRFTDERLIELYNIFNLLMKMFTYESFCVDVYYTFPVLWPRKSLIKLHKSLAVDYIWLLYQFMYQWVIYTDKDNAIYMPLNLFLSKHVALYFDKSIASNIKRYYNTFKTQYMP